MYQRSARSPPLSTFLVCAVVLMSLALPGASTAYASIDDARRAIYEAEQSMAAAYRGVLNAEEAGADVSGLVADLNAALDLLSYADSCYDGGDYVKAAGYAAQSREIFDRVAEEAVQAKEDAVRAAQLRTALIALALPAVLIALAFLSYRAWKRYRKQSLEKLMKKRVKMGEAEGSER